MGCCLSDKPQNYSYTLKTHIDNLEILLAELKVDKFSLVVHDWGGAIGMGLAGRYPERVESLVILNTAAFCSRRIPMRINICRAPIIGDVIVRGFNGFARGALSMAVVSKMSPAVARGYLEPYDTWAHRVALLRFVQDIPLKPEDPGYDLISEVEAGLERFADLPMTICWGLKDFVFDKHFLKEWQRRFPNAEVHAFADCGHYILEDASDEVIPIIEQFLAANPLDEPVTENEQ